MKSGSNKQRLHKKELISNIFTLFSKKYDSTDERSIFDISIPISEVQSYLEEKCNVKYTSSIWIYTQIKRYEDVLGVRLFQKIDPTEDPSTFNLSIYPEMTSYTQFQHLYLTHKLKIANGIYDLIRNSLETCNRRKPLKLLLGSGTNTYHLSSIIAEKSHEGEIHYHIYTHNLGIISSLMEPQNISEYIKIFTPAGMVDPVGNTIVGNDNDFYLSTEFDFIIQSTNTIHERKLYVQTKKESERKRVILKECKGIKILALVMDEFKRIPDDSMSCYGELSDYDFIVVPKTRNKRELEYESILHKLNDFMTPKIVYWNYVIYKTKK